MRFETLDLINIVEKSSIKEDVLDVLANVMADEIDKLLKSISDGYTCKYEWSGEKKKLHIRCYNNLSMNKKRLLFK